MSSAGAKPKPESLKNANRARPNTCNHHHQGHLDRRQPGKHHAAHHYQRLKAMKTYRSKTGSYLIEASRWHKPGDSDRVGEGWSSGDSCGFLPPPQHLTHAKGLRYHPVMTNTATGKVIEVASGDWICCNKTLDVWYSMTDSMFRALMEDPAYTTMRAHQYLYYVIGEPVIADHEFDRFCRMHSLDSGGGSDRTSDYSQEEVLEAEAMLHKKKAE